MTQDALERKFHLNLRCVGVAEQDTAGLFEAISTLPQAPDLTQLTAALHSIACSRHQTQPTGELYDGHY